VSRAFLSKDFSHSSFVNEKNRVKKKQLPTKNFWRWVGVGFGNGDSFLTIHQEPFLMMVFNNSEKS